MKRPKGLPDFRRPPINEVVLGVQFAPQTVYQQIRAGEVWVLFKDKFPYVQELPPLQPHFETFGQPAGMQANFGFVTGAQHDRFWFTNKQGDELIQFQNDRLLQNWRKTKATSDYPRFEHVHAEFSDAASKLESYFESIGGSTLDVNQCEVVYVNHIFTDGPEKIDPAEWLSVLSEKMRPPDDFTLSFRRTIQKDDGSPIGRLSCECATGVMPDGREFITLQIAARAMPLEPHLQSALEFFERGREMIVSLFAEITTDSAHRVWERIG